MWGVISQCSLGPRSLQEEVLMSLPEITHWWGWGVHSESAYFHISESSKSKGTTAKFPLGLKLLKHFVSTLSGHKVGILHALHFALDSLPVLIKSKSTEFTRSNFYLSLRKGLITTAF